MTDKIDIEKLARETAEKVAKYRPPDSGVLRPDDPKTPYQIIRSAIVLLEQEHNAELARLEAGCAQCRVKHEADAKGLEAHLAEYHEQVDRLMLDNASWESTCARLDAELARLTAAVQAALDWRDMSGDGISDPTRQALMDAIAKEQ